MKPYKLPPSEGLGGPLVGPNIEEFGVCSWCPSHDGTGPATAVAITIKAKLYRQLPAVDVVLRIKSPMELDRLIQMLLRHKRDVWPDAG